MNRSRPLSVELSLVSGGSSVPTAKLQFGVRDLIKCDLLQQLKTSYLSLNSVTAVEFIFAAITESRDYGASAYNLKLPSGH